MEIIRVHQNLTIPSQMVFQTHSKSPATANAVISEGADLGVAFMAILIDVFSLTRQAPLLVASMC